MCPKNCLSVAGQPLAIKRQMLDRTFLNQKFIVWRGGEERVTMTFAMEGE